MSPPWHDCYLQAGVAVIEREATVEGLIDAHFGTGEAEAVCLLRDLEATAVPLHEVVVADDTLVHEAADTVERVGRFPPGGCGFACLPSETTVVVGDKFAQHGVGGIDVGRFCQAQFAGEAILQDAPEAFDAALGLRTIGSDEGDAELFQGTAELRGLAFSSELFVDGPVVVVADEDAAVIPVEGERYPVSAQHLPKQAEIAEGGFRWEELCGQDLSGGIVVRRWPRPSSQSCGLPSSCTSSPSRAERRRRWR